MQDSPPVNMDQCIKDYAAYLKEGGEPLMWTDIFDEESYTPLEVMELLIESHIIFSNKDPIIKHPERLDAFDQIVHSCLQDILIQLREGRTLAIEHWNSLQDYLEKAVNKKGSHPVLLSRLILQIAELGFRLRDDLLNQSRNWMEQIFEDDPADQGVEYTATISMDGLLGELFLKDEIQDEFWFFEVFSNQIAFLHLGTQADFFTQLLHSDCRMLKDSLVLFLLHPQPCVRQQVLSVLSFFGRKLSFLSYSRLIQIRNWLPLSEKKQLDEIIGFVKKAFTQSAAISKTSISNTEHAECIKHLASTVDGTGSQNLLSMFKLGSEFQVFAGVIKENVGWVDVWSTPMTTRKECEATFRKIKESLFAIEVSQEYVKSIIPVGIAWNLKSGILTHPLMINWSERVDLRDLNPREPEISAILSRLKKKSPRVLDKRFQKASLLKSRSWLTSKGFANGWYESGEETELNLDQLLVFLEGVQDTSLDDHGVVDEVVKTLIGPERNKWYERFARLAYWASENTKKRGPNWEDFLVLATVLKEKMPIENIPLMREMGVCTLSFHLPPSMPN